MCSICELWSIRNIIGERQQYPIRQYVEYHHEIRELFVWVVEQGTVVLVKVAIG